MPLKSFQEAFWNLSDTNVAPTITASGGYPQWQSSVIGALFGALWEQATAYLRQWRWSWQLLRRVRATDDAQQRVLLRTLDLLEHPAWPCAQHAVRQTATTLGFANPSAWVEYGRMLKADQGRAENVFRHVRACELTRQQASSTLSNPTVNALVELAYQEFAMKGR